jgi:4-hydroxybenzoate polyprenyltransferase
VSLFRTIRTWGRMVKFPHSVFALPFALSGAALAAVDHGITWPRVFWIVIAMVAARNAAMGFNRLVDQRFDAENPRTAGRELPRGVLSRGAVWGFTAALSAVFVLAAFQLNRLCGLLSPVALVVVFSYSYSKRFTWASHVWLGLALAMAPVGGWLGVRGSFSVVPWLLATAVLLWVAGFDVVYACQDTEFDRARGLYSLPSRFGVATALWVARILHVLAVVALAAVGVVSGLHPIYWVGLGIVAAILAWEHRVARADDLSRVGMAFFNMNAVISVVYFATVLAAIALPGETP